MGNSEFTMLTEVVLLGRDTNRPWWDYPGLEFWKFLNLIVFATALTFIVRRRVTDALRSRREGIRRAVLKAQNQRDEAVKKLAEVDSRLAGEIGRASCRERVLSIVDAVSTDKNKIE